MNFNPLGMMGNGPMAALLRAARGGGNPMQIISTLAGNDPKMKTGLQMVQGKNPQQLEQMARNMAKERGTSVEEIMRGLGI